ncbi:MAG: acyl-CoA dehydrogenase family protein [Cyclobacteriaceae bacterium]|nr:acyl-CoA dehydrogenase family protein [Cyclobacteriaceae bacterium]
MLNDPVFKGNPSLYVFLPMYYTVWCDAVLTPTEITTIHDLLEKQSWLTKEEKDFLYAQLDPGSPPAPEELKNWLEEIHKVANQSSADSKMGLAEMGLQLAKLHGANNRIPASAKKSLLEMEATLGVISGEATFSYNAAERKTITGQQATKASFDVARMAALLDGHQAELIGRVKTVISDPVFNYPEDVRLEEYRELTLKWCKLLADQGFGAQAYPEAFGGKDDMEGYFTIMEAISYRDLSMVIKFGVQFGLFGMSIYFLGTEKHHKKYLNKTGTLELPGCFAMTETGHGSNVKGILTTATYNHQDDTFTIHTPDEIARKEYIGNAALHGQMATVFAKLILKGKDYGVNAFLVPIRDEEGKTMKGVTIKDCGPKMGLNGVDNGVIYFNKVTIPKENMLDRFASVDEAGQFTSPIASDNRRFFTMLGTLVGGRIGIPRSANSASKSGLAIAIKYADQRRQFGPDHAPEVPILNYRTHQRRLMPLLATVYAQHFALQYLTQRFLNRTEDQMQEIEALAAGLKAFTTWNTTHTLQECREACGGKGYLAENRISALKNDTDVYTTFEGDNTVLMQLVAKSRLTEFKHEFSNINLFGILNYVASQAKTSLTELNPLVIRKTDENHLMDPEFHLSAFQYRERDILTSAARRLKKHLDSGMDSFDAFNQTQYHLVNVGHAFVERVVLEQFMAQVERTEDAQNKTILKKLCALFALSQIEKNKGWYLEHGYMEGVKTKAIRKLINKLCWEVRQDAVPLVEAFAIPDSCLAAPIALN